MIINLSPVRMDGSLALSVAGDVLTINGAAFDFTPLPEGASLPREAVDCPWLASDVARAEGEIVLALILPHGAIPWPAPPEAAVVTHPAPLHVAAEGPVALPSFEPAGGDPEAQAEEQDQ